jgi:hypothetical protein
VTEQSSKTFGLGGEYSNEFIVQDEARRFFFETIRRLHPAPLHSLRDDVFPVYKRWADEQKATQRYRASGRGDHPVYYSFLWLEEHEPDVAQAISKWAHDFHLIGETPVDWSGDEDALSEWEVISLRDQRTIAHAKAVWPCDQAARTLWAWHSSPRGTEMMNTDPPEWVSVIRLSGAVGLYDPTLQIDTPMPEWFPQFETESKFRKRVHQRVDDFINSYVAEKRTMENLPAHRQRFLKNRDHFEWAVLFQVAEWEYSRIAEDRNVEAQTVRDGIKDVAKRIGLDLRRRSRGRPAKIKNLSK